MEADHTMLIPGSDEEKQYLEYLLNKHKKKGKSNQSSESVDLEEDSDF